MHTPMTSSAQTYPQLFSTPNTFPTRLEIQQFLNYNPSISHQQPPLHEYLSCSQSKRIYTNPSFLHLRSSSPSLEDSRCPDVFLQLISKPLHLSFSLNIIAEPMALEVTTSPIAFSTLLPTNNSLRHCGLVGLAPTWDRTGREFDSWQNRINIPCSLSLRLSE